MRDLPKKLISRDRFRRRQALAILLFAATPALAEPPTLVMPQALPFGSADHRDLSQQVRSNPFCNPSSDNSTDTIQLASGDSKSSIRLKPIGKAIGLKSMEERESRPDSTADASSDAMTIELVPAQIRRNPLIDSVHRDNNPLVETELIEAAKSAPESQAKRSSTLVLRPVRPIVPVNPPTAQDAGNERSPVTQSDVVSNATNDLKSAEVKSAGKSNSTADETIAKPIATNDEPPVHFSFSDRNEMNNSDAQDSSEVTNSNVADSFANAIAGRDAGKVESDKKAPIDLSPAPSIADSMASHDQAGSLEQTSGDPRNESTFDPPLVAPEVDEPRLSRRTAVITAPARPSSIDVRAKRYRPPVAVKTVPLAIGRDQPDPDKAVMVQPVPQFDPQTITLVGATDIKRVSLQMSLADVRTLTIGSRLHGARVADHAVCKVVQAGANQLKLIGTGEGVTELLVVADGKGSEQAPKRQVFEIHVSDKTDRSGVSLAQTAQLLNRSIAETFPGCQVLVRHRPGELTVAGRCDSQTSAKKILRMVRKTCLVPVRDELIVP